MRSGKQGQEFHTMYGQKDMSGFVVPRFPGYDILDWARVRF